MSHHFCRCRTVQLLTNFSSFQKRESNDHLSNENYDLRMMKLLSKNLWPEDGTLSHTRELKARVVSSVALMVASKLVTIQVPFLFKGIIDNVHAAPGGSGGEGVVALVDLASADPSGVGVPVAMVLGYGIARTTASAFGELRSTLFSSVAQRAIRQVTWFGKWDVGSG
jgi:ATP-binding cassette, subfamily B (MDR/TAP), member 7